MLIGACKGTSLTGHFPPSDDIAVCFIYQSFESSLSRILFHTRDYQPFAMNRYLFITKPNRLYFRKEFLGRGFLLYGQNLTQIFSKF